MFSFDGKHASDFVYKVTNISRPLTGPISPVTKEVPGRPGLVDYGTETGALEIEAEIVFKEDSNEEIWSKVRALNSWLIHKDLKKLEFDDEPGKYYLARFVDQGDLEEIVTIGLGSIRFFVPDPYMYGKEHIQRVSSASAIFDRPGIRYREDGTEVSVNYPVYKEGKYGKSILIEEGTENLLSSASSPTNEEVTVTPGDDYYLSTIEGNAKVNHKTSINLPKTHLDKSGSDVVITHNNQGGFDGTHNNTEKSVDGIRLKKSGSDYSKVVTPDEAPLLNFSTQDNMSDFRGTGWETVGVNSISQGTGYVVIDGRDGISQQVALRKDHGSTSPYMTFCFYAKVSGDVKVWLSNGSVGLRISLPNTGDYYRWFYIRRLSDSVGELYLDGIKQSSSLFETASTTTTRMQFYIQTVGEVGYAEIEHVYFDPNVLGIPPASGVYTYTHEVGPESIRSVRVLESSFISWSIEGESADGSHSLEILTSAYKNGEWSTPTPPENRGVFPGFYDGDDLWDSDAQYKVSISFTSKDPGATLSGGMFIQFLSFFSPFGVYTSQVLDISKVSRAMSSLVYYRGYMGGGIIDIDLRYSFDEGETWGDWLPAELNQPSPGIDHTTDLSRARVQYQIKLSSTDSDYSPEVEEVRLSYESGFKQSQTITLDPIDVSNIATSPSATALYSETTDEDTNVLFEYSLDGETFNEFQNGSVWDSPKNVSSLLFRYTLSTVNASKTPIIGDKLVISIQQSEQNKIKPAFSAIEIVPENVLRWQLENKPYPTGWHNTGIRNPEALKVWIGDSINELKKEGTLDFWANETGFPVLRHLFDSFGKRFALWFDEGRFYLSLNGNIVTNHPAPDKGWHHFAVRWEGLNASFFLDGVKLWEGNLDEGLSLPVDYLFIGCSRDGSYQWNSLIDDFSISKRAKTEQEILDRYNSPDPAQNDEDTVIILPFDGSLDGLGDVGVEIPGTAEAWGVFEVRFVSPSNTFTISNGVDYVLFTPEIPFKSGDSLIVDMNKEKAELNGNHIMAMSALSFDSDFFPLIPKGTVTVIPAGVANVDLRFIERWL